MRGSRQLLKGPKRAASIAAALALLASGTVHAQANYDGVDLGGRTAIMGGATVARGSDGATVFMNPAGITRIPGESFSFGTVAVSVGGRKLDGLLDPSNNLGIDNPDAVALNVRILPNTFCLFLDGPPKDHYSGRSRHKYGVCAADTENEEFYFTRNEFDPIDFDSGVGASQSTRMKWARSTLAMAWGFQINRATSIGVSVRVENSRLEDQTSSTALAQVDDLADMQTLTRSLQSSSWDTFVVLGLQHQVDRHVTFGASFSTPALHIMGFHTASETYAPVAGAAHTLVQDSGDFRYNPPSNLRLGLAFAWPRVNFEVNGSYHGQQDELALAVYERVETTTQDGRFVQQSIQPQSVVERGKPVVNFLAGAEFFIDPDFSILTGFQTDFTGLVDRQEQRPADTLFRHTKDAMHLSVGAASYGKHGSLLVGLKGYYAWGDILIADPVRSQPTFTPLAQSEWQLAMILSGALSFEGVRDTAARAARPLTRVPSVLERDHSEEETAPPAKPAERDVPNPRRENPYEGDPK